MKPIFYFGKAMTAIYLRDVSKSVSNHFLKQKNKRDKNQLQAIKYNNENVAHEMRAPLGSIISTSNLLIQKTQD